MESKIKIHASGSDFTRDIRPRWLLHEMGVPFAVERVDVLKGAGAVPAYRAVNPTGKVPFLEDGEVQIFESGAILIYLADLHGAGILAPRIDERGRAEYLQWIFFTQTTLETPATRAFANRTFLRERPGAGDRAAEALAEVEAKAKLLETHLGSREVLVGDRFSAADIMLATTLFWLSRADGLGGLPVLRAYFERHSARPAFKRTMEPTA